MIKNYFRELNKLLIGNRKVNQPNKRYYWKENTNTQEFEFALLEKMSRKNQGFSFTCRLSTSK